MSRRIEDLTPRERDVLEGAGAGLTITEIAQAIGTSSDTVKTHLRKAFDFLGARSSTHALVVAHELGYLPLDCGAANSEKASHDPQANRLERAMTRRNKKKVHNRVPLPADLHERFPSTTWGEDQWFAALSADQDLFHSILEGIGRVSPRRAPKRRRA